LGSFVALPLNNFVSPYITILFATASQAVWLRHLITKEKILGSIPSETNDLFTIKRYTMQWYILFGTTRNYKMFLLYNIPGEVPPFLLYKQDITQVICMQINCHEILHITEEHYRLVGFLKKGPA
jgi:hypothetical protein